MEEKMKLTAPERPGWRTTEFWLALAANVLGGLLASGVLEPYGDWPKIVGVAVMVLASLGYTANRAWVKGAVAKSAGPKALLVLALPALLVGCAGWKDTTRRSLAIAQDVAVSTRVVADQGCKPVVKQCIAAKLNPCKALLDCHAKRRVVYRALLDTHAATTVGYRAIDAAEKPQALQIAAVAIDAARKVCEALKAWGKPLAVCDRVLGSEVSR